MDLAPQAWKVIRTRRTEDISVRSYSVTVTAFACWLVCGLLLGKWPIIVSKIVCLGFSGFILAMAMLPRRQREVIASAVTAPSADQADEAQNSA